jgi:hypothetical protein
MWGVEKEAETYFLASSLSLMKLAWLEANKSSLFLKFSPAPIPADRLQNCSGKEMSWGMRTLRARQGAGDGFQARDGHGGELTGRPGTNRGEKLEIVEKGQGESRAPLFYRRS